VFGHQLKVKIPVQIIVKPTSTKDLPLQGNSKLKILNARSVSKFLVQSTLIDQRMIRFRVMGCSSLNSCSLVKTATE
jgi:hypothetical protein